MIEKPNALLRVAVGTRPAIVIGLAAITLLLTLSPTAAHASPGWDLILDRPSPEFGGMDFVSDSEGWLTAGAGLLHTTDGGATWSEAAKITVTDVDFADAQHGWAIGLSGAIYGTSDGGATWSSQASGTDVHLSDVFAIGAQEAWAVGDGEGFSDVISYPFPTALLHTTDGGATWQLVATPPNTWFQEVTFVGMDGWALGSQCAKQPGESYCGGEVSAALLHTADGGATWTLMASNAPRGARSLAFVDALQGWVLGLCPQFCSEYKLYHTTDGGTTWQFVTTGTGGSFQALAFRNELEGFAVSEACAGDGCTLALASTADGGSSWSSSEIGPREITQNLQSLLATNSAIYLAGSNVSLRSTDGGALWEDMATPAMLLREIDFVDPQTGFGVGAGHLYRSDDAGVNWRSLRSDLGFWPQIDFVNADRGFLARLRCPVCDLVIERTVDGGDTWTEMFKLPVPQGDIIKVQFVDADHGWVVMGQGSLLITSDGGQSWEQHSLPGVNAYVRDAELADADHAWATISEQLPDTRLVRSDDGGRTWVTVPDIAGGILDFVNADTGWNATTACEPEPCVSSVLRTTDGGLSWTGSELDAYPIHDMQFTDPLNGWLSAEACRPPSGCAAHILHSGDGGATWTTQASGDAFAGYGGEFSFVSQRTGWFLPGIQFIGLGNNPYQRTQLYHTTDGGGGPIGVEPTPTPKPELPDTGTGAPRSGSGTTSFAWVLLVIVAFGLGGAALAAVARARVQR